MIDGAARDFALREPAIRVAPSLLAADFTRLGAEVAALERGGAEVLHLDVMDGHFVPNLSFGPGLIAHLRRGSRMFFDAHLMITEPARYAESFAQAGCDLITFHIEVTERPEEVASVIRRCGCRVGVSINPTTPAEALTAVLADVDLVLVMSVWPGFGGQSFMAEVLPKVRELHARLGPHQRLEIDGGIDADTIAAAVGAGADTLVAGTAIFGQNDRVRAWRDLTAAARAADAERGGRN